MLTRVAARPNTASGVLAMCRIFLLALLALFPVAGCSKEVPRAELSLYRAAFAEVHAVSEQILIDFAEAKESAEAVQNSRAIPSHGPHQFDSALINPKVSLPPTVTVRRLAFRTINEYNNALIVLAEGKSIESVKAATGGFVNTLGKFIDAGGDAVPGLNAISGLAQTLTGQVERARVRAEFEKAVRDGAPIVLKILDALIAERQDHIELRLAEANLRQLDILDDITTGVRVVQAIVRSRTAPSADAEQTRSEIQSNLNDALEPANIYYPPITLAFGINADELPEFSETDRVLADEIIARIKRRVAAYRANIAQFEGLRGALNSYGEMLHNAGATLDALVVALDRPQNFEQAYDRFFEIAFNIKRDIEAIRAARGAATN